MRPLLQLRPKKRRAPRAPSGRESCRATERGSSDGESAPMLSEGYRWCGCRSAGVLGKAVVLLGRVRTEVHAGAAHLRIDAVPGACVGFTSGCVCVCAQEPVVLNVSGGLRALLGDKTSRLMQELMRCGYQADYFLCSSRYALRTQDCQR